MAPTPRVWLPMIRARSGTDVFTRRLGRLLTAYGVRCEISELPHWVEYAPYLHPRLQPPAWANVTHVNSWLPARFLPRRTARVATVHHVVHLPRSGVHPGRGQSAYHRLVIAPRERQVLAASEVVTTVSRHSAREIGTFFGLAPDFIVPNWVDTRVFFPRRRTDPGTPFRLLFPGNWSARKGADLLPPIMRALGPHFELLTTGLRPRHYGRERLPENIRPLPYARDENEMAELYRRCDALLFPSRLEGFGLAVLEAQACGLPVLATAGSALPEVVAHGKTGLLCPAEDVTAFVRGAQRLREEPSLWREMSGHAAEHAARSFGVERAAAAYLRVYCEALERRSA